MLYSYNKLDKRKCFFKLSQISKNFSNILIEKKSVLSGAKQLKSVLFKGQLYS